MGNALQRYSVLAKPEDMASEMDRLARELSKPAGVVNVGDKPESPRPGEMRFDEDDGTLSIYSRTLGWVEI